MIEAVAIIVLGIICIGQFIFILKFSKTLIKQMDDAIKAVLSKTVNEYVVAKNMDRIADEPTKENTDEVELSEADDATFDKFIKTQ